MAYRMPFDGNFRMTCSFACHKAKGGTVAQYAGVDWGMPIGTPVKAAEAGTVTTHRDKYGALWVKLMSKDGVREWQYVHLSRYGSTGSVRVGTVVGYSGNTGYTTGAHLHFALKIRGVRKDPMSLITQPVVQRPFGIGSYIKYTKNTRVRKGNGLSYPIQTTARAGTVWKIIGGARYADGYEWWDVQAVDQSNGEPLGGTGWSALAKEGGTPWAVKVSKPTPPPVDPCKQKLADQKATYEKKLAACKAKIAKLQGKETQAVSLLDRLTNLFKR